MGHGFPQAGNYRTEEADVGRRRRGLSEALGRCFPSGEGRVGACAPVAGQPYSVASAQLGDLSDKVDRRQTCFGCKRPHYYYYRTLRYFGLPALCRLEEDRTHGIPMVKH